MSRYLLFAFILLTSWSSIAQLNGTYTVGGSNPDYASISAAVNALSTNGSTGPVTFDIRPGIYTGNYDLIEVPNADFVTFRSSTMNATDVILEHNASSDVDNYIFLIDSTEKVVFDRLTFNPLDFDYAKAILFHRDANLLQINRCVFNGSQSNSSVGYQQRVLVHCDETAINTVTNTTPNDVVITNNTFNYGYAAMDLDFSGQSGYRSDGLLLIDNTCNQQLAGGFTVKYTVDALISGNTVLTDRGEWFTGIRTRHVSGATKLVSNRVEVYSNFDVGGIEFSNTQGAGNELVANNMVYVNGPGELWGITVYNLYESKVEYNTAVVEGGDPATSYAFYHLSSFMDGADTHLQNNVFTNYCGGPAVRVKTLNNVALEDHNALFTSGSNLVDWGGTMYADLATYQSATGLGFGSVGFDPAFPILADVHLNSCAVIDLGISTSTTTTDIDGDPRSASTPDMGADEFTFSTGLISAVADTITSAQTPYTLTAANGSAYTWSTGEITQSIQVTASSTYNVSFTDVNGCSYSVEYPIHVIITTDVSHNEQEQVLLWPNPASDALNIRGVAGNWSIFSADGRLVQHGNSTVGGIAIADLPSGAYILRAGTLNKQFVKR